VLFDLKKHAQNLARGKQPVELAVQTDNSPCHKEQKVIDTMKRNYIIDLAHSPDSLGLSPPLLGIQSFKQSNQEKRVQECRWS
jgi:hypothetical protein